MRFIPAIRSIWCVAGFLLLFSGFLSARALHYVVAPVITDEEHLLALRVELRCTGDNDGITQIQLPHQLGTASHLYRCYARFRCAEGWPLRFSPDSTLVQVAHPAQATVTLLYELSQDWVGILPELPQAFRPWIQPDAFQVLGLHLFLLPSVTDGYEITTEWTGFAPHWQLENSFGHGRQVQQWTSGDEAWLRSVFTGGAGWRLLHTHVATKPVRLALWGHGWAFSDSMALNQLQAVVACQREFWQDNNMPDYLVTLMPLQAPDTALAYTGIGLHRSFSLLATPLPAFDGPELDGLLHHELMHEWIGGQIRMGGAPNDMQLAWFSEGFTEYFALLNQYQCGGQSPQVYAERVNRQFFEALWTSEYANASNEIIAHRFFTDKQAARLPYLRGFVWAFYLDQHIVQYSGGKRHLRDIMLDLRAYFCKNNQNLSNNMAFFIQKLSTETGEDMDAFTQKYLLEGALLPADSFVAPAGMRIRVHAKGWPVLEVATP